MGRSSLSAPTIEAGLAGLKPPFLTAVESYPTFSVRQLLGFQECLPRGLARAVFAGLAALFIILLEPRVHIYLEFLDTPVNPLTKGRGIRFILSGAVELFTDAVALRGPGLGPGVVDILKGQVELLFVVPPVLETYFKLMIFF